MKETEKVLRELEKFMKESDEGYSQEKLDEFMEMYNVSEDREHLHFHELNDEEKAQDMLYDLYDMDTEKEQKAQLKKLLKLDPYNIDALVMRMDIEDLDPEIELPRILEIGKKKLHEKKLDDKASIGSYWGIIETRPYIRAKFQYFQILRSVGKFTLALEQGMEILALNESDNTGSRFGIMAIYASLERYDEAVVFLDSCEGEVSAMLYIPMILLCLRLNKKKEASTYYKELQKTNKDFSKVFHKAGIDMDEMQEVVQQGMYAPYSADEIYMAVYDNINTFMLNLDDYFDFFYNHLVKTKKKPAKKELS